MQPNNTELVQLSPKELDQIVATLKNLAKEGNVKFVIQPREVRTILSKGVWIDMDSIESFVVRWEEMPLQNGNTIQYPVTVSLPTRLILNWEKIPAPLAKKLRTSIRQALAACDKVYELSQENDEEYPELLNAYEAIFTANLAY